MNNNIFSEIKSNFASGLVVFLVALPLCLGIAIASGAPPLSGLIAGIIGGIVIGVVSNSNISVSGPAAGLTAVVLTSIHSLGSFELFLCAVFIAGIMQLVLGFLKAGSISNYFPNNVIEGMLAGIGLIIIFKQIPHAIGYDPNNMSTEGLFDDGDYNIMEYIHAHLSSVHWGVFAVFVISLAILLLWDKSSKLKSFKLLPGALVAVIISILLDEFVFKNNNTLNVESTHLVNLPIPQSLGEFQNLLVFPNFSGLMNANVWIIAATIAVVASIETLLCIEAADRMDIRRRITNTNLELKAQGIGNMISSMIGGLPMTSVVVRTSANANSGATSKMSTIIHGFLLLLCFILIPNILNKIPLATLAAVLILVGYKLANPAKIKHFFQKGKYQFFPFIVTMIAVFATDLLKGVGIGLIISLIYILRENLKSSAYLSNDKLAAGDTITLKLAEEVSFLNKAAIKKTLRDIPSNATVIINAENTTYIAADVLELIEDFANIRAKEEKITVELKGFKTNYNEQTKGESLVKITHKRTI
jgi:MFS superfamily sulfate permease-like transporter